MISSHHCQPSPLETIKRYTRVFKTTFRGAWDVSTHFLDQHASCLVIDLGGPEMENFSDHPHEDVEVDVAVITRWRSHYTKRALLFTFLWTWMLQKEHPRGQAHFQLTWLYATTFFFLLRFFGVEISFQGQQILYIARAILATSSCIYDKMIYGTTKECENKRAVRKGKRRWFTTSH